MSGWVLSRLTQFEQQGIENEIQDMLGCSSAAARKVVERIFVPELDARSHDVVRQVLAEAAVDVERIDRIQKTPLDDVTPEDLTWSRAPDQNSIRLLTGGRWTEAGPTLAQWLRGRGLRGPS